MFAATVLGACGFPTQHRSSPVAEEEQPASLITVPAADARPPLEDVVVWLVRDDHLVQATRRAPVPVDAAGAVAALSSGITDAELETGTRSAIPDPGMVVDATSGGGTASVELAPEFLDIPAGDQVLALAQIVYTLTDLRGVGRVRFTIGEDPVVVPLPNGDSTEDSVSRDDFADLAAPP